MESEAAVAILHARATESVLLMLRTERAEDPWSGHWSFPGGRRDPRDGNLLCTALRELEEECGIRLTAAQLELPLPPSVARRKAGPFIRVAPFVFRVDVEAPTVLDPREAADALWVPLRVLRDPMRHALRPVPGVPLEWRFPAIDLNGTPLWGFTYRLITDWLGLNPQKRLKEAGLQFASMLLDRLIAYGCVPIDAWHERDGARVATVAGAIPVESILAKIETPSSDDIPHVNMVEVRPDRVRVVGLAFDEYIISVSN